MIPDHQPQGLIRAHSIVSCHWNYLATCTKRGFPLIANTWNERCFATIYC